MRRIRRTRRTRIIIIRSRIGSRIIKIGRINIVRRIVSGGRRRRRIIIGQIIRIRKFKFFREEDEKEKKEE